MQLRGFSINGSRVAPGDLLLALVCCAFICIACAQVPKEKIEVEAIRSGASYRLSFFPSDVGLRAPVSIEDGKKLAARELSRLGYCSRGIKMEPGWIEGYMSGKVVIRADCI